MKTKHLISAGKILSYAILILGIIHNIATFTPLIQEGLTCLDQGNLNAMIYMSLICGSSLILSGLVLIMLLRKVEEYRFLTSIILAIGVFLGLNGILSVVYMFDNPFAWISFVLSMGMFIISLGLKKRV